MNIVLEPAGNGAWCLVQRYYKGNGVLAGHHQEQHQKEMEKVIDINMYQYITPARVMQSSKGTKWLGLKLGDLFDTSFGFDEKLFYLNTPVFLPSPTPYHRTKEWIGCPYYSTFLKCVELIYHKP